MGRRGPVPTPTNILKLRGSTLVTRKRESREVKAPAGRPDPPVWLDPANRTLALGLAFERTTQQVVS